MSKLFWILVALVVLAPLPLGAQQAWAWTLMASAVALLLAAWAAYAAASRRTPVVSIEQVWPILLPFGLVVLWIAVQMTTLTPEGWHHPLWRSAAAALGTELPGAISINPFDSGSGLLRLLAFAGTFWLSLQFCHTSARAGQVFQAIALAGLAYAGYGLVVEFAGINKILWYDKVYYVGNVTSTIEYKNAYATYAGLGLICAVGLLVQSVDEASRHVLGPRERLRRVVSRVVEDGWILVVACIVLATALLLSNSRGGFIASAAAVVVLLATAVMARREPSPYARKVAAAVILGGIGFAAMSGDTIFVRLDQLNPEKDVRTHIYDLTNEAIGDTPWMGTGFRTFGDAFAMYRTQDVPVPALRAHNTYLDNALGLGVPGAAALTLAVAGLGVICVLGLRRRRRNVMYPCMGVAATVLVGVHALFDFTLQVPAVTATYCLMMGAACAQSWSARRRYG